MNVLEVQGLTKHYPAFTLNGVSFAVPEGAVMGFIGRNGAGKSTTLKSILGMVHPDAGEVSVFGMDYAANERAIRRELGVVLGGIDFTPKRRSASSPTSPAGSTTTGTRTNTATTCACLPLMRKSAWISCPAV